MKNLIGKTIKSYQILLKVRETATRILYRANDVRSDCYVGLEVVKAESVQQKVLYAALKEQAEKNARLKHTNIAPLLDSGIHEGIIYFVYDFAPARTLHRLFNQNYPWKRAAREFVTVAQTLAHAHQQGVVHGMLEPSSIILNDENVPYLYDFGMEQIIQNYLLGRVPGAWIQNWKISYASPEQLSGKPVDAGSDVYTMGIILYEWMTGEFPLLDETTLGTLYRRTTTFLDETALKKIEPPVLQELVSRTIARDPAERYRSMEEVSIVLAREALGLELTRRIIRKPLTAMQAASRISRKWLLLPILSVVLLGLAFAAWRGIPGLYPGLAASLPPTATHSTTVPAPTATRNPLPTLSPTTALPQTPTGLPTAPAAGTVSYPLRVGNALPSLTRMIPGNASHIIQLAVWGAGEINRYALSPDGKILAVATSQGVFVYKVEPWGLGKYLDTSSWVSTVAFSPDGKLLAAGDQGGLILVWDTAEWKDVKSCIGHRGSVIAIAFSPDGTEFVSAALDNQVLRWNTAPETTASLAGATILNVTDLTYSANGGSIITGGSDWKVSLWEPSSLQFQRNLTLTAKVVSLQAARDSSLLAVGTANRQVALVDLAGMKIATTFTGLQADLSSLAVSPDGTLLAAGDINGGIVAWKTSGELAWKSPATEKTSAPVNELLSRRQVLLFPPDGKTLLSGLRSGSARVFDAATGGKLRESEPITYFVSHFEFASDGQTAVFQTADTTLTSLNTSTGTLAYTVPGTMLPGKVFASNGRYFAALYDPATIRVYESASGKMFHSLNGNSNVRTISFLVGDNYLGAWNRQVVRLWSISSGQEIRTIPSLMGDGCTTISGPYKDVMAYVTGYDYLFDLGANRGFLCGFGIASRADITLINEASRQVVAVEGNNLEVFSFTMGSMATMENAGQAKILHMAVNPDGTLLAAALEDHSIRIWDVSSRTGIISLYGHDGEITDLHFTNDGKLLVSSSLDGTIRLWGIP